MPGPNNGAAVFSLREHKINEISATVISSGNSLRMAYTGVLKLLGAIARWILGGFRVPLVNTVMRIPIDQILLPVFLSSLC